MHCHVLKSVIDVLSLNLVLQIHTIEDKTEMEVYAPSAKVTHRFYDQMRYQFLDLKEKLEASWSKVFLLLTIHL